MESSGGPQGTDFVDMEAGGFDEGQGETNVSKDAHPENIVSPQSVTKIINNII